MGVKARIPLEGPDPKAGIELMAREIGELVSCNYITPGVESTIERVLKLTVRERIRYLHR